MTTLRSKPFETSYPRWRHLEHGYVVKVLGVINYRGENGFYSTVSVEGTRRDPKRRASWSADAFRKNFEPIGRKKKARSATDRLIDED
jgi:hypothetical protein